MRDDDDVGTTGVRRGWIYIQERRKKKKKWMAWHGMAWHGMALINFGISLARAMAMGTSDFRFSAGWFGFRTGISREKELVGDR
jgi:hypothetical protein